jgi:hypothetical protein
MSPCPIGLRGLCSACSQSAKDIILKQLKLDGVIRNELSECTVAVLLLVL